MIRRGCRKKRPRLPRAMISLTRQLLQVPIHMMKHGNFPHFRRHLLPQGVQESVS